MPRLKSANQAAGHPAQQALVPALLLITVVLLGSGALWWISQRQSVDPQTQCPVSGDRLPVTLLLMDRTSRLSDHQQGALRQIIAQTLRTLPSQHLLRVHEIDADQRGGLSAPLFSACRPRRGDEANPLHENAGQFERAYEQAVTSPLSAVTNTLLADGTARQSPLLESLQDAQLLGHLDERTTLNRLILVSDLLQHGSISFYTRPLPDLDDDAVQSRQARLEGIDVQIYWLQTHPILQDAALQRWWEDYFRRAFSRSVHIERIRA